MENTGSLSFTSPTLYKRLKAMLGVDFYRLFHTPMFYIFLAIAAVIPAMVLGMANGQSEEAAPLYTSVWQIIAADEPLYVVNNIGEYANMNMVFIFGGIMISIFIGHDYRSGYVKQLFTTHPQKQDYIISKTVTGAFSMACMCVTYLIGGVIAGAFTGVSFAVNAGSLICAIIGKMIMSLGWAALYSFLNVIFRRYFGICVALSFFLGTGILVIGGAAVVGNSAALNIFLYGSSVYACLSADFVSVLVCLCCSVAWAVIYTVLGSVILNKSDVY